MEAAITIAILALLIGVGASIPAVNKKCLEEYGYKPFNLANAGLSFLSFIVLIIMLATMVHGNEWEATANTWVLLGLYLAIIVGILWNIISKTSPWVGLYVFLVLQLTNVIAVIILLGTRMIYDSVKTSLRE